MRSGVMTTSNLTENRPAIKTYVIDLFCGAGGTSTAIHKSDTNIEVVACINHDANAIISHAANYPNCLHFTEDIRIVGLQPLIELVQRLREQDPDCKIGVWASLECINFSGAKITPKDEESRTLANSIFRYLDALNPDFLWIENVKQFKNWGPLDRHGYEIPHLRGSHYNDWVAKIAKYFNPQYWADQLTSADYNGVTIRNRLFIQFAKNPEEIGFPVQTNDKQGRYGLKPWRATREILELDLMGNSIFNRKTMLVSNTHRKIFTGTKKFYKPDEGIFGIKYHKQIDPDQPCSTLATKDRVSVVRPVCMNYNYGTGGASSIERPVGTITTIPKVDLIQMQGVMYNPQYGGSFRSINDPAGTLIARQDKAPVAFMQTDRVPAPVPVQVTHLARNRADYEPHVVVTENLITYKHFANDDEWITKLKLFMEQNQIIDIMLRPLTIKEMLRVQGFPDDYVLRGTQTEQKKYIGNSVEVQVGMALMRSIDQAIQTFNGRNL